VAYNSAAVIERCLRSCRGIAATVVENGSGGGTLALAAAFDNVVCIANKENRGFAAAVNQAVAGCDEEFILLLNPDVELLGPPGALAEACRAEGADMAAGKLVGEDGRAQRGFGLRRLPGPLTLAFEVLAINRMFPANSVNKSYRYLERDSDLSGEVEQPAGAFLLFRRELWQRLGGFDERFHPIWFEDVDFCKRAREAGARILYFPSIEARHTGGHSVATMPWECRELVWYVSLLRYASKHFRPFGRRWVGVSVTAGSLLRMLYSICRKASFKPVAVYGKVIRLSVRTVFMAGSNEGGSDRNKALMLDEFEQRKLGNNTHPHVL
jgi:N-acetylglucosaminyl-diphospho-decaprenol L-rhamnosyltransferase